MPHKTVMKPEDVTYRRRLLARWDFACVVCGHGFSDLASVTKEHVVPRSAPPSAVRSADNLAPSHYRCNKLRGTLSIIQTAKRVERLREQMGHVRFFEWLNAPVPNRIVPPEALLPPRTQACLEPPDRLPGLP